MLLEMSSVDQQVNEKFELLATAMGEAVRIGREDSRQQAETGSPLFFAVSVRLAASSFLLAVWFPLNMKEVTERYRLAMLPSRRKPYLHDVDFSFG
jgi:hypothetical protein